MPLLQVNDQELRRLMSAEKIAELRAAAASPYRRRPARVRLGESLVSLALRLTAEYAPSRARTA